MSEATPLQRPHLSSAKLVTPEDLQLQQQYFREKLKRHNRSLHGFGIVFGLKVTIDSGQIVVDRGLALDCEGNELAVDTKQSIDLPATADGQSAYLSIRFSEDKAELVPASEATEVGNFAATLTDSYELMITQENSNRGHRHLRARWLACGRPHALTIAKLGHASHGWHLDRGYRPPGIK